MFILMGVIVLAVVGFIVTIVDQRANRAVMCALSGMSRGYSFRTCLYALAQMRHETNNFTSNLFERANNVSGMKKPTVRATKGIVSVSNGYAVYNTVWNSMADYWLRQNAFSMPKSFVSIEAFSKWNKDSRYYEDSLDNYTARLKFWYNSYGSGDGMYISIFFVCLLVNICAISYGVYWLLRFTKSVKKVNR